MTRRNALILVGALVGYLDGKPVAGQPRGLTLPLDGVDAIILQYKGQRVVLTPQELIDALAPVQNPAQQLYRK